MPYWVLLMLLFWNVLLLLPVPRLVTLIVVPPEPTPNNVVVLLLPTRLRFFTTLFVAASAPAVVCNQMTADDVPVLVFVIVMSRDDVPLLEPSIVTQSEPFRMTRALALDPVMVIPGAFGLIVTVLVELAPGIELIVIG